MNRSIPYLPSTAAESMASNLDAVRVSQIRSISFAQGDIQRYQPPLSALPPTGSGEGSHPVASSRRVSTTSSADDAGLASRGSSHASLLHHMNTTTAYSPLSASERACLPPPLMSDADMRVDEATYASLSQPTFSTDTMAPLALKGTVDSQLNTTTKVEEPSEMERSLGPSLPTVAFNSQERLLTKYLMLLHLMKFACGTAAEHDNATSNNSNEHSSFSKKRAFFDRHRAALSATLQQCAGFTFWLEAAKASAASAIREGAAAAAAQEVSAIRVLVTPREQQTSPAHRRPSGSELPAAEAVDTDAAAAGRPKLRGASTVTIVSPRASDATNGGEWTWMVEALERTPEEHFFLWNSTREVLCTVIRDAIADFPKLIHLAAQLSPQKVSQAAAAAAVIGVKRSTSNNSGGVLTSASRPSLDSSNIVPLNGWSRVPTTDAPGSGGTQPSSSTFQGPPCNPQFSLAIVLIQAFVELFQHESVQLVTQDSSELLARERIAFRNILDRLPTAVEQLRQPALAAPAGFDESQGPEMVTSSAITAKATRAASTQVKHVVISPAEDLLHLSYEWSRQATARHTPTGPQQHRYIFSVTFDGAMRMGDGDAEHAFVISPSRDLVDCLRRVGAILPESASTLRYTSDREGVWRAGVAPSDSLNVSLKPVGSGRCSSVASWRYAVLAVACALGAVLGFAPFDDAAGTRVALGVVAVVVAVVGVGLFYAEWRGDQQWRRLQSIERWLSLILCDASVLLLSPVVASDLRCRSFIGAPTSSGLSSAQGGRDVSSASIALSTPSPYPSSNASMLEYAYVKTGNTTPPPGSVVQPIVVPPTWASASTKSESAMMTGSATIGHTSNLNGSDTTASKKPNPLTTEAIMRSGELAGDDDDEHDDIDVVRVRMDPTGTFLIPFLEGEPILLDGLHVHRHLALMGVEFTRDIGGGDGSQGPSRSLASGNNSSSTAGGSGLTQSHGALLFGDDVQDEDRYSICMWNLAMSECTGGYTAAQIVDQTLAQVMADSESYTAVLAAVHSCESAFASHTESATADVSAAFRCDPFVVRVVHRELGKISLRVTVSPVTRSGEHGELECIGALIAGVAIDAPAQLRAFNYRSMYLSEVMEECWAAVALCQQRYQAAVTATAAPVPAAYLNPSTSTTAPGATVGVATLSPPSPSLARAVLSPRSPASLLNQQVLSRLDEFRRVNEYFFHRTMSQSASVSALSSTDSWRAVYSNFIPGMLAKSFPNYQLRVKVDSVVPSIVEANISAITAIIDRILNTTPCASAQPSAHAAVSATATTMEGSASIRSAALKAALSAGGALPTQQPTFTMAADIVTAAPIRITFGVVQEDGVSMYCRVENLPLEKYAGMVVKEIELEENTGVDAPTTTVLGWARAAEARILLIPGADVLSGCVDAASATCGSGGGISSTDDSSPGGAALLKRSTVSATAASAEGFMGRSFQHGGFTGALGGATLHGHHLATGGTSKAAGSFQLLRDSVVIIFPFRPQSAADAAISAWETREKRQQSPQPSGASSQDVSFRDSLQTLVSPTSGDVNHMSPAVAGSGGSQDLVLSVMVDAISDLDRQKYTRRLWEDHHSVFPIDGGKFLSRGLKLLRSQCRTFDAVLLDAPAQLPRDECEKRMEEVAREFPQTAFVVLRPKKIHVKRRSVAGTTGVGHPPLHPSTSSGALKHTTSGGGDGLLSFAPVVEKPKNLFYVTKAGTVEGIDELIQFVARNVRMLREEHNRQTHLQRLFREHRTGPWTKGKKLGRGTFGDVYEACLTLTGGKMAVKVIRLPSSAPERMAQLINEIEILVSVQHSNIVQYFYCEAGQSSNEVNVFMELCTGGSLQGKCQSLKPVETTQMSAWIQQLCSALAYLHRNHLAHRDIKPANILLTDTNDVKLADFGTAAAVSVPLRDVAGTFAYMAPEVYNGNDYGTPCDIWSVGCVLLDLLGKEVCSKIAGVGGGGLGGGYFSDCSTDEEIMTRVQQGIADPVIVDFLRGCLHLDPMLRCTAEQLLLHPFVTTRARNASPPSIQRTQSGATLTARRSSPNLARKSHESSVGALSMDSGAFGRHSSRSGSKSDDDGDEDEDDGWGDDSSDDEGWVDVVRGAHDSDVEADVGDTTHANPVSVAAAANGRAGMVRLSPDAISANAFTPKVHNVPTPLLSRGPSHYVAESPSSAAKRRQNPNDPVALSQSPVFATNAAALARRRSMRSGGGPSPHPSATDGNSVGSNSALQMTTAGTSI